MNRRGFLRGIALAVAGAAARVYAPATLALLPRCGETYRGFNVEQLREDVRELVRRAMVEVAVFGYAKVNLGGESAELVWEAPTP